MKITRYFHTSLLLVLVVILQARGQSPEESHTPWHGYYMMERFATDTLPFVSIIGNGGSLVQGSQNLDPYGNTQTVGVALPFKFLLNRGAFSDIQPESLRVGITGVVSMNRGLYGSDPSYEYDPVMTEIKGPYHLDLTSPNNLPPEAHYHLLAPFWGEFTSLGVSNGGIYTKSETLADREVFTIEWRVRPFDLPGAPPRSFQIKFVHFFSPTSPFDNYWIEYHYDNSGGAIPQPTVSQPGYYGAFVGMKHEGQGDGMPTDQTWLPSGDGVDGNRLFIYVHPNHNNLNLTEAAYTRLPTRTTAFETDLFAFSPIDETGLASPFFHYSFPPGGGYRSKPIEQDVASIDGGARNHFPVTGLDSILRNDTGLYVFPLSDTIRIAGLFDNQGTTPIDTVPVRTLITKNGILVQQLDTTISSIDFGGSAAIVFPGPLGPQVADTPGVYTVTIIARLPGDGDPWNDTISFNLTIQDSVDMMVVGIPYPELRQEGRLRYYSVGEEVPVRGRFMNSGTQSLQNIPLRARILDRQGNILYQADTVITGEWNSMEIREIEFPSWDDGAEGEYVVEMETRLSGDGILENNRLNVADTRIGWRTGESAEEGRIAGRFGLLPELEVEVGSPGTLPHFPRSGAGYIDSVPVIIAVKNNGASGVRNLPVRVVIRDEGNQIVYDQTVLIDSIQGSFSLFYRTFPLLIAAPPGLYSLEAEAQLSGDNLPANNTATWSFTIIDTTTSVADPDGSRGEVIAVNSPARQTLRLYYNGSRTEHAELCLVDVRGREAKRLGSTLLYQGRELRFDVSDLSAGMYILRVTTASGEARFRKVVIVR